MFSLTGDQRWTNLYPHGQAPLLHWHEVTTENTENTETEVLLFSVFRVFRG
jgi:hypothetical protein